MAAMYQLLYCSGDTAECFIRSADVCSGFYAECISIETQWG